MEMAKSLILCTVLAASLALLAAADWSQGTATFYGGADGSGTMGGACGYGNLYNAGYGINNAALSQALFNDGASCGQCYTIMCDGSRPGGQWCKLGTSITMTATNLCPPNYALPSNSGGWCNPPRPHFDMSQPAWEHIGVYQAGIVPVVYQRVQCSRSGGVRFSLAGSNYFLQVNIQNVGGSGSVAAAWVKGTNTGWIQMSRNWGANWQALSGLVGQAPVPAVPQRRAGVVAVRHDLQHLPAVHLLNQNVLGTRVRARYISFAISCGSVQWRVHVRAFDDASWTCQWPLHPW